jgi:hypothetical protein
VTFYGAHRYPPSCRAYGGSRALLNKVFSIPLGAPLTAVVIHLSALPTGAGVYLNDSTNQDASVIGLQMGLVHTSYRCTGG